MKSVSKIRMVKPPRTETENVVAVAMAVVAEAMAVVVVVLIMKEPLAVKVNKDLNA